jgi:outer membrane receptor for ferrienterochelin and colicins
MTSVSGQSEVIQAETDGYNWMDFTLNKKLFRFLILNAGIRNLMNITTVNNSAIISGAHSSAGAMPIGYGRSFFAGLVFNWEK